MNSKSSVYFPNINSIRFFAALLVIIGHINLVQFTFGYPSYVRVSPFIDQSGHLGVVCFFVLSGFLITFLLLKEKELTNTINIKKFYIRRVLRIWPLYFLLVLTAFLLLPNISFFTLPGPYNERSHIYTNFWPKLLLYIFILPNMVSSAFGYIPYAIQAWSIGAEEQFYLIWPWFMKKVKNKLLLMVMVIVCYGIIKFLLNHFAPHNAEESYSGLAILNRFWGSTAIDCMAIGSIFALMGYEQNKTALAAKKILFHPAVQAIIITATVILIAKGVYIPHVQYEAFAVLFGIIIINLALNPKSIINLEYKPLNYLGKISYGLYMYHFFVIVIVFKALLYFGFYYNIIFYPLSLLLTILVSGLSYQYFEKPFIKKKIKFSDVISGEAAQKTTGNYGAQ